MRKPILTTLVFVFILLQGYSQTFNNCIEKGDSCFEQRELHLAISYYQEALKIKPERLHKTIDALNVLSKLGDTYFEITDYQTAMSLYFRYLDEELIKNNDSIVTSTYNKIGRSYSRLNQFEQSLKFFNKAKLNCPLDDIKMQGVLNNNIADVYYQVGNYVEAKKYFKIAQEFFIEADFSDGLFVININLGNLAQIENKVDYAKTFLQKAERIAIDNKDTTFIVISQIYLAKYYINISDYDNAESQLEWTLENAIRYNMPQYISESYENFVKLYEKQNKYKKAFEYLKLSKQSSDSLFNINTNRNYADLEAKYSIREKEEENQLLKKDQELSSSKVIAQKKSIWLLSGLFVTSLLFLVLFLFQLNTRSKSRKLLEAQNKEIKKSQTQLKDLNYQYEKLIAKYESGQSDNKPSVELS